MNNRYTLPIAFALAVHASLMFGFRPPVVVREANATAPRPEPPVKPEIEIVPIEERSDSSESVREAKGAPDNDIARGEEPDPLPTQKPIMPFTPPLTRPTDSKAQIFDPQPIGIPTGDPKIAGGPSIFTPAGLDKAPHAQVQATPDYPFAAKREGLNGEVVVEFLVDETGRVSNPAIVRSTNSMFDEPSLRAVLKWRFEPGRRDGRVVRFRMAVPVVFRLNND